MRVKNREKEEAFMLRERGYSLNEISSRLKISKSSASIWLKNASVSLTGKIRIQQRRQEGIKKSRIVKKIQTTGRLKEASEFAEKTLLDIEVTPEIVRLLCALMYWCEGEKSLNDNTLIFTNSDPLLMRAFLKNLRAGFLIDEKKFRICLHLHSYHDKEKQLLFWSNITNIPVIQFIKPYQKSNSGNNIRQGYAGCASVRYYDVRIARQVHAIAKAFLKDKGP